MRLSQNYLVLIKKRALFVRITKLASFFERKKILPRKIGFNILAYYLGTFGFSTFEIHCNERTFNFL